MINGPKNGFKGKGIGKPVGMNAGFAAKGKHPQLPPEGPHSELKKRRTFEGEVSLFIQKHPRIHASPIRMWQMIATFNKLSESHPQMKANALVYLIQEKHPKVVAQDAFDFAHFIHWAQRLPGGDIAARRAFLRQTGKELADEIRGRGKKTY